MTTAEYADLYEVTDTFMIRTAGLADALLDLLGEHPAFATNDRSANAIRAVAETLAEVAAAGADAHSAEHSAVMALARFGAGNV